MAEDQKVNTKIPVPPVSDKYSIMTEITPKEKKKKTSSTFD